MLPGLPQIDLASLVPQRYAAYRPLLEDAAAYFLGRLPPAQQRAILRDQAGLPPTADAAMRLVAIMHRCPTLHKLGQVVARHRPLDAGFRRRLQGLEMLEPQTPFHETAPTIEAELERAHPFYDVRVGRDALAEASVAVVLPCWWRASDGAGERRGLWLAPPTSRADAPAHGMTGDVSAGVLKVLKPGVVERLETELDILGDLAGYLDERRELYDLPAFAYRETFNTVRDLLIHEVRCTQEQRHLAAAAARYARRPGVVVPRLLPFCTPRMTAMTRIDGVRVTDASAARPMLRRRLAETIIRSLIADIVLSREPESFFHADPHAGNLFATDDDQLAILDWSLVGQLTKAQREQIARMIAAAVTLDAAAICRAVSTLSTSTIDETPLRETADTALCRVSRGTFPGLDWMIGLLDAAVRIGARFDGDLLLFRKTLLTLEGVVHNVCPDVSVDGVLVAAVLESFSLEWPSRALAAPGSRDFATHLSNAELMQFYSMTPLAFMQAWASNWSAWAGRATASIYHEAAAP